MKNRLVIGISTSVVFTAFTALAQEAPVNPEVPVEPEIPMEPETPVVEAELYATECIADEQLSTQRTLKIGDVDFVLGQNIFLDTACQVPGYAIDYNGTYVRDAELETVDWLLNEVTITPASEAIAGAFTQSALCGIDSWEAGVASNATGLECQGSVLLGGPTFFYDRLRESEEGIQLGLPTEEFNGTTPELRPVEFEEIVFAPVVADEEGEEELPDEGELEPEMPELPEMPEEGEDLGGE